MYRLRVATPCTADWDSMTPTSLGRFCTQCEREVVDFTNATEKRAKALTSLFGASKLCGRVACRSDGSTIFINETATVVELDQSVHIQLRRVSGPVRRAAAGVAVVLAAVGCEPPLPPSDVPPPPPPALPPVLAVAAAVESTPPPVSPPPVDSDGDQIVDSEDACPMQPGPARGEPGKNGCPFVCSPVTMGQLVIVQNATFAANSTIIPKSSVVLLDEIANVLAEHPELKKVEIQGHASGDEKSGQNLSEKRATAVKAYLTGKGIDGARLTVVAYGSTRPRVDESKPENREMNRRVEFKIAEQSKTSP